MFLGDFPTDVTVFLVEAESLAFGIGLTPRAAAAAATVADRIVALIHASLPVSEIVS
jgi:hydrogenase maturation protease